MVIVDTTVWIDYYRGVVNLQTDWLETQLGQVAFGLTDTILCEVLQGISSEREFQEVRENLARYQVFNTGGAELAFLSAQNYRILRAQGRTVRKTIDCLIATFCLTAGHTLLHRDSDFDAFEELLGLQVVHPTLN